MRQIILVVSMLLASACSMEGEAYHCWDKRNEVDLEGTARVNPISGNLVGYSAVDPNGLQIEIDGENSHNFVCTSLEVIEERRREAEVNQQTRCEAIQQSSHDDVALKDRLTAARCDLPSQD